MSIFVSIPLLGTMRSAPYRRVGRSRDIAKRCARWGERPEPTGESLLTVAKAPWATPTLLEKCVDDARLDVNQYPSHLTQGRGGNTRPSRHLGGGAGDPGGSL